MDADESDNDVSSHIENNSDEEDNSSEEDSGEESDDDSDENDDGTTDAISEDDDGETVSDDDDGGEDASTAAGDDIASVDSDAEETFDKGEISDLGDPDMSCPICLNEFAGQDLGSPENCNHTFCFECILEWSKNINTCPIDRIEFHLIYMKQEISGDVIKKVKVKVKKEVEEYVEEVTLCEVCRLGDREDRLLLCDSCDSGYHCECLDPPLERIPIEEWFCPPCAQVLNRRVTSPQASHSRLIARTSASEIVRSRIQHHRTAYSGDSGSETTQQPRRVHSPARAPVKRKTTKRRKTKRKTTRKSSKSKKTQARTKATSAGKSKSQKSSSKTSTKRKRKIKRRKTSKKKKKSKKSWLASMKLVAPSVKKRIADHLGLCKPPPGHSMPYVKKSGSQYSAIVESAPSLDVFGCRDQLFDFSESYTDDDLDNPKPSTSKRSRAIASRCLNAAASTSGINILDNILENQTNLLQNARNITIGKDGSLNVSEKNSMKVKCGLKSLKNEAKDDASVVEQNKTTTSFSSLVHVKKEKDAPAVDSSSSDTKKVIAEDTPSSVSVLSYNTQKEKTHSHPRVRFNDTETVFKIENNETFEETGEMAAEGEYYPPRLPHSQGEEEDIPPAKESVHVERGNNLPLNSLMDTQSTNTESQTMSFDISFDITSERVKKERNANERRDSKDVIASPVSFSKGMHKQTVHTVTDSSITSTNKPILSCNSSSCSTTGGIQSLDNHCQLKSAEPLGAKTETSSSSSSSSSFVKAENDRKRHLPFLSNSLQRPFKIPKLVKKTDKSLDSEKKLLKPENTTNHSNVKVPTKPKRVDGNLAPKELVSPNKTSHCDFKLKNSRQKRTSVAGTDLGEPMDIEVNHKRGDFNSSSSLDEVPRLSDPESSHPSDSKHHSERTASSLVKVISHSSRAGSNSDSPKLDRRTRNSVVSSSSKVVKNDEHRHKLNASDGDVQISKPAEKSCVVQKMEPAASGQICNKVSSKQKLKEDIALEIKKHLKDFYVTDLITKDEYKEIMRRSVPKVFQNCGNSIDSAKIRKLVISYVHVISNTKADSS